MENGASEYYLYSRGIRPDPSVLPYEKDPTKGVLRAEDKCIGNMHKTARPNLCISYKIEGGEEKID